MFWRTERSGRLVIVHGCTEHEPEDSANLVIENIFQWPGVGVWFTDAIKTQNTPIIMSVGLFMVLMVLLSSLLVDILTAVLDPRVKLS